MRARVKSKEAINLRGEKLLTDFCNSKQKDKGKQPKEAPRSSGVLSLLHLYSGSQRGLKGLTAECLPFYFGFTPPVSGLGLVGDATTTGRPSSFSHIHMSWFKYIVLVSPHSQCALSPCSCIDSWSKVKPCCPEHPFDWLMGSHVSHAVTNLTQVRALLTW